MAIFAPILLAIEAVIAVIALGLGANTLHDVVRVYHSIDGGKGGAGGKGDAHDDVNNFFSGFGKHEIFDHARILELLFAVIVALLALRVLSVPFFFLARFCGAIRDRLGHRVRRHGGGGSSWLYTILLFSVGTAAWVLFGMWIGLNDDNLGDTGNDVNDGARYVWDRINGHGDNSNDLSRAALAFWVLAVVAAMITSIALSLEGRNDRVAQTQYRNEPPYNSREAKHADVEQARKYHSAS